MNLVAYTRINMIHIYEYVYLYRFWKDMCDGESETIENYIFNKYVIHML